MCVCRIRDGAAKKKKIEKSIDFAIARDIRDSSIRTDASNVYIPRPAQLLMLRTSKEKKSKLLTISRSTTSALFLLSPVRT